MSNLRVDLVLEIRWETEGLLAVAKPPGLPVFPPHGDPTGDSVLSRLLDARPGQRGTWPSGFEGGIAHRLDGATSGQLLVARDLDALARLRDLFAGRALAKRYVLLTDRDVTWDHHEVHHRLAHDKRHKRRMIVERGRATPHRGRWFEADTELRRLGPVEHAFWAWEAVIRTGVTHQVRAHAAFVGLALAGDRLYGGGPSPSFLPPEAPFALHHLGAVGPDLAPPPCPLPACWPDVAGLK